MNPESNTADAKRRIRLLHLEDSSRDAELIQDLLETDGLACDIVRVENRESFEAALAGDSFDLILCDYNLPNYDGISALKRAKELRPAASVIMVSGALSEEEAVTCLHLGASDYLLKQRLGRLSSAVRRALDEAEKQKAIQTAEANLRESERRHRTLLSNLQGMACRCRNDHDWTMEFVSQGCSALLGISPADLTSGKITYGSLIHPDDRERVWQGCQTNLAARRPCQTEYRVKHADGSWRWVSAQTQGAYGAGGEMAAIEGYISDITERKRLEAQMLQAQKMESVGRLAGGVAHDFNNLLGVIIGYADIALDALAEEDPLRADVQQIRNAGDKAAALTRQLLAFSRKQVMQPEVLDLRQVVAAEEKMLGRLIGEDIELIVAAATDLGRVKADQGQIEQVVMNLAVNARDAMPRGGTLTIALENAELDQSCVTQRVSVKPGPYVMVSVSDTGTGMDEITMEKIFDPFFTTKELGKGTGLGLATVYGIVKQCEGYVFVHSEVGKGTTFQVYLPRVEEEASPIRSRRTETHARGTETILLVEDEDGIRLWAQRILTGAGYTVLPAAAPDEALRLIELHKAPVHLVLTDVVMPGMNGRDLVARLAGIYPGLKILYMSGYLDDTLAHHGVLDAALHFIGKPFTGAELTRKVREVLDVPGPESGGP